MFYRPEAVHLGDLLRIRVRPDVKITLPPAGFQGPTPMHRTPREARRFTDATSLSLDNRIPGSPLLTKKRELFPGSTLASPRSVALPHWAPRGRSPTSGSGILTRFPFDRIGVSSEAGRAPLGLDRGAASCRVSLSGPLAPRAHASLSRRRLYSYGVLTRAGPRSTLRSAISPGKRAQLCLLPVQNGVLRSLRAD